MIENKGDDPNQDMHKLRVRLAAAHEAGRGCNLTPLEVKLLGITSVGEWFRNVYDEDAAGPAYFRGE